MASKSSALGLYVDAEGNFTTISDIPMPELEDDEILVKVLYSGVNPADCKHSTVIGIKSTIMGYDFCGEVVKVAGPKTQGFSPGDIVGGFTLATLGKPLKYGAHQEYLATPVELAFHVPANLPHTDAAALTTVVTTAADGLYNQFGLPLIGESPSTQSEVKMGPLLIWGGSTGVGLSMLQLARASGISPIFVTASPKRHALLQKYGATACFDYAAPDVMSQIQSAVDKAGMGPIAYAADCAGAMGSAMQMKACVGDDALLLSVMPMQDSCFKFPLALKSRTLTFQFPGAPTTTEIPGQPEEWAKMRKALEWAVKNYGSGFSLPLVEVFKGSTDELLQAIKLTAEAGRFGKLVIQHPLLPTA
ncbi:hypothetical protein IAQ61_007356 [Plenodomus lingam]|uniref:Similar to zinc-binding oxidoreductase ToxD n=1 Tax=Leptosphaeria maculans (strain JN3 / isolate v23.1.3 / race Av1-4-5-6-7-8) TaxID=985895 RepID=E5A0T5_LEPMJ|nr:similar to zinc-binding oxidoreductase ToxD [Plenodomus lingam JN3]KAH9868049.1 hypothetical protein IAQ61_007356 [Plenodomus lingam]CBX97231.1 similar to zinc-binding oxidoreductase ToxD [Plenodomus lingam JN3]